LVSHVNKLARHENKKQETVHYISEIEESKSLKKIMQ